MSSLEGACLCGAVALRVELPSLACVHCHCTMCQRNHGAAYVTWFVVKREQFSVAAGADQLVNYASSNHGSRSFCGRCGSSLFCELDEQPDDIDVVLANMKGPLDRAPQMHVFWSDRAQWTVANDGLPRLGGETGMEPVKDED